MVTSVNKWLILSALLLGSWKSPDLHPFYISVTEINQDAKEKTVEVSCKMFTDDLESTINRLYKINIDLTNPKDTAQVNRLVGDYITKHLQLISDGKKLNLQLVGYERENGAIWSYFQAGNITSVKKLEVMDNLLYESFESQISILHVTVNGSRKSTKLNNPEKNAVFNF